MLTKFCILLLILCFLTACSSQRVMFLSDPPGAQIAVDGEPVGTTPCEYLYKSSSGESYEVTVEKDGYAPSSLCVKTDQVDKPARKKWLAAGLIWSPLWLGTLFTKKLKDSYRFVLEKATPQVAKGGEAVVVNHPL